MPASINPKILADLASSGATSFRINLSHSTNESLDKYFNVISVAVQILAIDTQGSQLRVIGLTDCDYVEQDKSIRIIFGSTIQSSLFSLLDSSIPRLILNHHEASSQVSIGDTLKTDFGGLAIQFIEQQHDNS